MDETTTGDRTLTDEDILTVTPGASTEVPERPMPDEDGTDTQDQDGTDTQDQDGTDSQDTDGTDSQDTDGTDAAS
jgi:hypothetical protein